MKKEEAFALLDKKFQERKLWRVADLEALGIWMPWLAEAKKDGRIASVTPGVVATPEAMASQDLDYVAMNLFVPELAIYGQSAANLHQLSDSTPQRTQVLVPHAYRGRLSGFSVDLRRTRNEDNLRTGIVDFDTDLGMTFRVTSPARTIVDLYREPGWRKDARDALVAFVRQGGDVQELREVARSFQAWDEIGLHLEMITDLADKGVSP